VVLRHRLQRRVSTSVFGLRFAGFSGLPGAAGCRKFRLIMNRGGLYLAVYDVAQDRERNRLASVLEHYGVRVQKSAFEVRLSKAHRDFLLRQLNGLGLQSGWVVLYRVDEGARRHVAGQAPANPLAEDLHAYVL
jgi:CRISPR-associated endonuclease Cas2